MRPMGFDLVWQMGAGKAKGNKHGRLSSRRTEQERHIASALELGEQFAKLRISE